jgi:hypothetical protein
LGLSVINVRRRVVFYLFIYIVFFVFLG